MGHSATGDSSKANAAVELEVAVMRDVKDLIGAIMRVLEGGEISEDDVLDLEFEADGELLDALNDGYIKLLEFVHDRERRMNDSQLIRKDERRCSGSSMRSFA
jgi:MOSC domain-containing protein YiiM